MNELYNNTLPKNIASDTYSYLANARAGLVHERNNRSNSSGGLSRFRRASAAKRAASNALAAGGKTTTGRVEPAAIRVAQQIDPTSMLESAGYVVRSQGRHLSARTPSGDEVYRVTLKSDGIYVACDRYQNGIGDNIALARELEPGLSFPDAVFKLNGGGSMQTATFNIKPDVTTTPPRLPKPGPHDIQKGRDYLKERGIDKETIEHAEQSGIVQYVPGGVVFVGKDDEGVVRSATRRAVDPNDEHQKRDFKGTGKEYPAILPGDPKTVLIVEGGVDALAAHTIARRTARPLPTVIVSGGSNVLSFLDNQRVQDLLKNAEKINVAKEREKDLDTEKKVDIARAKQVEKLKTITLASIKIVEPGGNHKDIAAHNLHEVQQLKAVDR